jgi:predicted nucleotidyltransferase
MSIENPVAQRIVNRITGLAEHLGDVTALGLSGSYACGEPDAHSDVDICVYVAGVLPSAEARDIAYRALGLSERLYWDADFGQSRGDGFRIEGVRCDLNWMSIPAVSDSLQRLLTDHDAGEWLPGGLSTVVSLHDPEGWIERLRAQIPPYSEARTRHRLRAALGGAHHALYSLGWLDKAVARADHFSFLKYEYQLLERLFTALFALNRVWYSDEKRLTSLIMAFETVPVAAGRRIRSIIVRDGENRQPDGILRTLKSLFAETASLALASYPGLDVPAHWT